MVFFQSIFLQQDAIKQIYELFNEKKFKINKNSSWSQIRDLRNLIIGHPIEKWGGGDIKRCFLTRVTMSNKGLDLIIWSKNGQEDEMKKN